MQICLTGVFFVCTSASQHSAGLKGQEVTHIDPSPCLLPTLWPNLMASFVQMCDMCLLD